jgi:hypothetical protein
MSAPNILDAAIAAKGDLSTTYLEGGDAGRGLLPPSAAREFIAATALQSDFITDMNLQVMLNPEHYLDIAGFSGRVSYKDVPGVATTEAQRSALTISREPLKAVWFRAASFLNYHVENENIQRMGLGAFVQADLARQVALDQDESMIIGDTDSADDGVDAFDGIIKQALAYTIDSSASPADVSDDVFYSLFQGMPKRGKRDKANMVYACSVNVESAYAKWLRANTNIATGSFYEGQDPGNRIKFDGIQVKPYNMWPDDTIMLVNKRNVCPGIFIKIFLEQFHDPDAGVDKYIMRYASDIAFAEPELVIAWTGLNLGVAASL